MFPMLAVLGLSGGELVLVLVAVLILFGAKKIPDFAKGLGQGIKEFKKASREVQDELERATSDLENPPPYRPPSVPQPARDTAAVPQTPGVENPAPATPPAPAPSATPSPKA